MERHIKKHQVFSWSHAYLDYKGIKKWLGNEYPFGCWYVAPSDDQDEGREDAAVPAAAVAVTSHPHHVRSLSTADAIGGGTSLLFGAEVISPLQSHKVLGGAARRPLEIACYVANERHHHRQIAEESPLAHSPAASKGASDRRRQLPSSLWPNVVEVRYPQQIVVVDSQRFDSDRNAPSSAVSSPILSNSHMREPDSSSGGTTLFPMVAPSPTSSHQRSSHHRVCIPSRTVFTENPYHANSAARGDQTDDSPTGPRDDVPAPVVLIGCDTPSSHLRDKPLDAHVLSHIHGMSKRNMEFMRRIEEECQKVEQFYLNQTRAWSKVLIRLVDRAHVLLTEVNLFVSSTARQQQVVVVNGGGDNEVVQTPPAVMDRDDDDADDASQEYRQSVLIKQLEATEISLQRIYFAYTLLARFVVQNTEAIHHLLRKVETRSQQYLDAYTAALENQFSFMVRRGDHTHPVGALLDWIEKEYIVLIGGDKKAAAHELHVAEDDAQSQDVLAGANMWNGIAVGIMFGATIACIAMVFVEVQLVYDTSVPITTFSGVSTSTSTVLMALTGLVAVFAALFAINIVVWDVFGVHYAFIFELDDRFHWDGLHLLRYSMRYVVSWAIGLLAFVYAGRFSTASERTEYVPYAILAMFGVLLVYDIWAFQTATTLFKVVPMVPRRVARKGRVAFRIFNRIFNCCRSITALPASAFSSPNVSNHSFDANSMLKRGRHVQRETFLSQDWSRSWLGRTLWRILTAPYFPVSFSDFYMADQLTSLTGFFGQVQVIVTAAIWGGKGNQYPILAALPHVWRLLQCMRRFRDQPSVSDKLVAPPETSSPADDIPMKEATSEPFPERPAASSSSVPPRIIPFWQTAEWWHPNLTNALKYLSGIIQIVVSWRFNIMYSLESARVKAEGPGATIDWTTGAPAVLLAFWILAAALEYLKKLGWDIYMDAGLLRIGANKKNKWASFLRPQLIYPIWTYWVFVVLDVTLRFSVFIRIMLIVKNYDFNHVNPVFWWGLEVFRRFVWNFFRVENEQVNNMESYRAVDVVPPVWAAAEEAVLRHERGTITVDGSSDLDEDDLAAFGALWGTSSKQTDLPAPQDLFRRLPIANQKSALFGFALQQRWTVEAATKFWNMDEAGLLQAFSAQNVEHQTRIVFLAVGDTPFAQFLQTHRTRRSQSSLLRRRHIDTDANVAVVASPNVSDVRELVRMAGTTGDEPAFVIAVEAGECAATPSS
ncbi:Hypothetical protein, putative [Bodo saltans]|uniref:EXS domain-containing protein n=1 Tax=Bodo saltans TaxID=75058 RepID=A0A0S4IP55_BODSA|nr:Hypothetical protein, putative [Bodo saltans]|eukprot:CUE69936.1 Hypothetical protein, putative [Bodo saltans]